MKTMVSFLALFALLLGNGKAEPGDSPKPENEVKIDNFSFIPPTITVKAGTPVTWINKDDVPHTVVGTGKEFSSRVMDTDETYTYKFTVPGSYEYYCSVHPHMKGKVIVE